MSYKIVITHEGIENINDIAEIDPFVSMTEEDGYLVIYNGFCEYDFAIDEIINIDIKKVE